MVGYKFNKNLKTVYVASFPRPEGYYEKGEWDKYDKKRISFPENQPNNFALEPIYGKINSSVLSKIKVPKRLENLHLGVQSGSIPYKTLSRQKLFSKLN